MHKPGQTPGLLQRTLGPLTINLDRQAITVDDLDNFDNTPESDHLSAFWHGLFNGSPVNTTEQRAAAHWVLRAAECPNAFDEPVSLHQNGQCEIAVARQSLKKLNEFAHRAYAGEVLNPDGLPYHSALHLGIGGSDLGPRLLYSVFNSLGLCRGSAIQQIRFVSNVDYHEMQAALAGLDPKRTLVLIASKSFSTKETLLNAAHILNWLNSAGPTYVESALLAATSRPDKALAFGVKPEHIFEFTDAIGGRYSLWGPVSLSVRMLTGSQPMSELLAGAALVDNHVLTERHKDCLPTLLAMADYANLREGVYSLMVSPYDSRLDLLVPYLQQLWMESLGKGVDIHHQSLGMPPCPLLWGGVGTNAQHAYFQLLHQSKVPSAVEIVAVLHANHAEQESHRVLLSHVLAQAQAFYQGRYNSDDEVTNPEVNHRSCPGKRPVGLVFLDELSPYSLGALLALWEHRTVALAAMQLINPFDQWGVELGKQIAEDLLPAVGHAEHIAQTGADPVTAHLINSLMSGK